MKKKYLNLYENSQIDRIHLVKDTVFFLEIIFKIIYQNTQTESLKTNTNPRKGNSGVPVCLSHDPVHLQLYHRRSPWPTKICFGLKVSRVLQYIPRPESSENFLKHRNFLSKNRGRSQSLH